MIIMGLMVHQSYTAETTSGCIAKTMLTELGLDGLDAAVTITDPTYCTSTFTSGRCIAEGSIKTVIETYQTEFTAYNAGFETINDMFDTFFGKIGETWDKIVAAVSTPDPKTLTWKDEMAQCVKKASDTKDKCYKSYDTIRQGFLCLVASGVGKANIKEETKKITVTTSEAALQVVPDCIDIAACICMYFKGGTEAKLDAKQTPDQVSLCTNVSKYEDCVLKGGTAASCMTVGEKKKIFPLMFSPLNNIMFPKVPDIESIKEKLGSWYESSKAKIFDWLNITKDDATTPAARILENATEVKFTFATEGFDLKVAGEKSLVPTKSIALTKIWGMVTLLVVFLKIA